jgi:hypothetical protein
MHVINRGRGFVAVIAAGMIVALAAAACGGGEQPTPIYIVTTLPSVGPTETPTPATTEGASESAGPSESPSASPSASVSPGPSLPPGEACTGSADNKAFFVTAANLIKFDVYCGAFGKGWYLSEGQYKLPSSGPWLTVSYKNNKGGVITIKEGGFCQTSPADCSPSTGSLGSASFGPMSGELVSTSGGGFAIYVKPGTKTAYEVSGSGSGVTQSFLVAVGAAVVLVPKS